MAYSLRVKEGKQRRKTESKSNVSGYVPDDLAAAKLGAMSHARWLTLASRILRYYVADPVVRREEVDTLARYVVQVYYRVSTLIVLVSPSLWCGLIF